MTDGVTEASFEIVNNLGLHARADAALTALTFRTPVRVFSALVTCESGTEGMTAAVSDSTTNTWGAIITGGGSAHVLAYCDGTNWTVAAR